MELTGERWKNYSTPSIDENNKSKKPGYEAYWQEKKLETYSLGELIDCIKWMKDNAIMQSRSIHESPVFIKYKDHIYAIQNATVSLFYSTIELRDCDKMIFTAPDSRPETGGEYWQSRGPSYEDCAGFVKSKLTGERIRRMVRYILDKDETKSWLDFREYEPDWIQFKFSAEEFDVHKLNDMSVDNHGVITEQMLRECVLPPQK